MAQGNFKKGNLYINLLKNSFFYGMMKEVSRIVGRIRHEKPYFT